MSVALAQVIASVPAEPAIRPLSLIELEDRLDESGAESAAHERADSTNRCYASDLADFCDFWRRMGYVPLPATPQTIVRYIEWLS